MSSSSSIEDFYYTRSAVDASVTQSQVLSQVAQEKLTWESGLLAPLNPDEETSGDNAAPAPTPRKAIYETVDEIDVIVKEIDGKVDGIIQDVLTPMKTTVDGISETIGTKIDASVAPIETSVSNTESAVNFMRGEVNDIKDQVQEIHEINALMHEILNRTLAPTLSPSQSPFRSVSCNVVPFVFHTQYIPHFTTCFLFLYILLISQPTSSPSLSPSQNPSKRPSRSPTVSPSQSPAPSTSVRPSNIPSAVPSESGKPSQSQYPSNEPTVRKLSTLTFIDHQFVFSQSSNHNAILGTIICCIFWRIYLRRWWYVHNR